MNGFHSLITIKQKIGGNKNSWSLTKTEKNLLTTDSYPIWNPLFVFSEILKPKIYLTKKSFVKEFYERVLSPATSLCSQQKNTNFVVKLLNAVKLSPGICIKSHLHALKKTSNNLR